MTRHSSSPRRGMELASALAAIALVVGAGAGLSGWMLAAVGVAGLALTVGIAAWHAAGARAQAQEDRRRSDALGARATELIAELARTRAPLAALDEPLIVVGSDGLVLTCNPAAERLLGVRADRLTGRPAEEAFTQSELHALYERARGGTSAREQVRVARAQGARVWDVSAIPLPLPPPRDPRDGPPGVLMCLRDATDAALALRVRADFVANASHELRTPIAAMRIALDTMTALEPGDEAMRVRLDGVLASNVARLEEMARDLLDLSRLESDESDAQLAPLALSDVARELRSTYEPTCAARRVTLTFDIAPGVERLRSDRRLLTLVLGNLIDNAAKFAFEGTEVRVVARPVSPGWPISPKWAPSGTPGSPNRASEARFAQPADPNAQFGELGHPGVRFEIIDRGVGIPLDQQSRIFERYYQVDAARSPGQPRRGTGLGLSIVKHAVRGLGGTIRVQSVWQQGTTMIVELPNCVEP